MRRTLYFISLIFVTFALLFAFKTQVNADACEGINGCRVTKNRTILVAGAGELYAGSGKNLYRDVSDATSQNKNVRQGQYYSSLGVIATGAYSTEYIYSDKYSALFCVDPQHQGYNPVMARRFLLDSNSSIKVQAFDIAVMSIVTNSGTSYIKSSGSSVNLSGGVGNDYFSRLLALRILMLAFKYNDGTGNNEQFRRDYYAGYSVAHRWLQGDDVLGPYLALSAALAKAEGNSARLAWENGYNKHPSYNFEDSAGSSSVANAKRYFINALVEATEFLENQSDQVNVTNSVTAGVVTNVNTADGELVQKEIKHTITVSGLSNTDKNEFIINGLQFKNNKVYKGLTTTIKSIQVGDTLYEGLKINDVYGKNLLELGHDFKNKTDIILTVQFSGYKSSTNTNIELLDCEEPSIEYNINVTYTGGNMFGKYSKYVGTIWQSNPYANSDGVLQNVQRYIGVEEAASDISIFNTETFTIPNKISLVEKCETNCDLLREACVKTNNRNSKECQDYIKEDCDSCDDLKTMCDMNMTNPVVTKPCDDYNAVCEIKCEVSYTQFECCDKEGDLLISEVENFDKPNVNNKEVTIKGPENIKACFVTTIDKKCEDAEDADNNSCVDVGTEDEKENSYALAATNNNKYCTVSCKEDYVFLMPTAKLVNSGRYFTFKAQIQGTKTCYTNTIDREQYNKDIVAAQVRLVNAYNEWYRWDTAYNDTIKTYMSYSYTSCCTCSCSEPPCGSCCCCNAYGGCNRYYVQGSVESQDVNKTDEKTGTITLQDTVLTYSYYEDGGSSGGCGSTCHSGSTSTLLDNIKKNFLDPAAKELAAAQEAYQKIVTDFNTCGGWDSQINFKPDVYYDYEEDYLEANGLTGEMIETDKKAISNSYWYCNSQIDASGRENSKGQLSDNNYERCTSATSTAKDYNTTEITYIYCTEDDGCQEKTEKISTARYKKMISKTATTYKPKTLFYNIYPSGTITINSNEPNTTEVPNGLPINLNTKRGIYKYTVNITNIGEFYNIANTDDNLGRYAGGKNSLLGDKIVYACSYLVNMPVSSSDQLKCEFDKCDDCTVDCIGPNCDNVCDGGNCVADCVGMGCIYDNDAGSQLVERIVSLNNLFPNGTTSYNWSSTSNEKAKETISAIQTKGNKAYEEEPILSITMDPSTAKEIVKYNDDAESSGGYSNNTLHCYKLGNYERAACYSEFIDMIIDGDFGDKVINEKSKIQRSNDYRTGLDVSTSDAKTDDDYFRLWNGTIDPKRMLGPSWR